jgi:hypothetical protein
MTSAPGPGAEEAAQHLRVAGDLEEEREHLLGPSLRLLHAAPHGGHAVLDGALLPLEADHLLHAHRAVVVLVALGGASGRAGTPTDPDRPCGIPVMEPLQVSY